MCDSLPFLYWVRTYEDKVPGTVVTYVAGGPPTFLGTRYHTTEQSSSKLLLRINTVYKVPLREYG